MQSPPPNHDGYARLHACTPARLRACAPARLHLCTSAPQKLAAHKPADVLRWAAFFGDTQHRVGTVTDGLRVTVAFELYRDGLPDPMADALLRRAEAVRAAFTAVVADQTCLPEGGLLGFEGGCCKARTRTPHMTTQLEPWPRADVY